MVSIDIEQRKAHDMCDGSFIFYRLDDAGCDMSKFERVISLFAQYGVPVCVQAIPVLMTSEWVRAILKARLQLKGRLTISQHGFSHKNYGTGYFEFEFGGGRPQNEQHRDMAAGMEIMASAFGDVFFPAFCPPFNAFDTATLYVAGDLGFQVFSQDGKQYVHSTCMHDFSATIDIIQDYESGSYRNISDLIADIKRTVFSGSITGVQIHHSYMSTVGMHLLTKLLQWTVSCQSIHPVTFSDLVIIAGK